MQMLIVDPSQLTPNDLTGNERVGVINKNTGDKVSNDYITETLKIWQCLIVITT